MATSTTKIPYVEGAAASTPAAGEVVTYAKADGLMYSKDDAGTETLMSGGGAADILDIPTAETNTALVLAPDGAGGVQFRAETGGSATRVACKVYRNAAVQAVNSATASLIFDTEVFDTDAFHFTSSAALTGTVAKTSGSAAIVGTGTAFTTELSVNQAISIPGTAAEVGIVKVITDNTHITLWANMANTASGQTATRLNTILAIPVNKGGLYAVYGGTFASATGLSHVGVTKNGAAVIGAGRNKPDASSAYASFATQLALVDGDYIEFTVTTNASVNLGHASVVDAYSYLGLSRLSD